MDGPIKIVEGLFIGDEFSSQDLEFIVSNKVTHIINCAARHIPNHWEPIGVKYLSFGWGESDSQLILDSGNKNFKQIRKFIEETLKEGESILIHSLKGKKRSICVVLAYLMHRYRWTLYKGLEFVTIKVPGIDVGPGHMNQLSTFEKKLSKKGRARSSAWKTDGNDVEELVATNTFLNTRVGDFEGTEATVGSTLLKVNWIDSNGGPLTDPEHPQSKNPVVNGFALIKSCLKGQHKAQVRAPLQNFVRAKKNFPLTERVKQPDLEASLSPRRKSIRKKSKKRPGTASQKRSKITLKPAALLM